MDIFAAILTALVGAACIVLGIGNMRGNLSSLHAYHRHRVAEEDRLPFGKKVGLGTVIVGGAVIIFSALCAVTALTEKQVFMLAGVGIMLFGLAAGLGISIDAMLRYNKGIF